MARSVGDFGGLMVATLFSAFVSLSWAPLVLVGAALLLLSANWVFWAPLMIPAVLWNGGAALEILVAKILRRPRSAFD